MKRAHVGSSLLEVITATQLFLLPAPPLAQLERAILPSNAGLLWLLDFPFARSSTHTTLERHKSMTDTRVQDCHVWADVYLGYDASIKKMVLVSPFCSTYSTLKTAIIFA